MGKHIITLVDKFGAMTNDSRDKRKDVCSIIRHFDNYTRKGRLSPHYDINLDADTSPANQDSFRIAQFLYANSTFFGLGVEDGTTKPKIFQKTNVSDPWVASTNGEHASSTNFGSEAKHFTLYQNYLWGIDGTGWWKYGDITSSPTWTRGMHNITPVSDVPPVVHSKDDIMYSAEGNGNIIVKNNSGSFSTVLTFPTDHTLAGMCEYGNYLALAFNRDNDTSVIYLWDRDSSLATLSEKIDWGNGNIKWIESIGETLIGCSVMSGTAASSLVIAPRVMFKYYNGVSVIAFQEFLTTLATIPAVRQKYNELLYFLGELTIDGNALKGIWKIVKSPTGEMSVSFDRMIYLDNAPDAGTLYGFLRVADYFHVAFQFSSAYKISETSGSYTTACIYEKLFNTVNSGQKKKLHGAAVMTEAMPAAGQIVLKYKKDEETSFTTIFINAVDDSISHSAINIESNGNKLPQYKEITFRMESTGNAEITGLKFLEELVDDDFY